VIEHQIGSFPPRSHHLKPQPPVHDHFCIVAIPQGCKGCRWLFGSCCPGTRALAGPCPGMVRDSVHPVCQSRCCLLLAGTPSAMLPRQPPSSILRPLPGQLQTLILAPPRLQRSSISSQSRQKHCLEGTVSPRGLYASAGKQAGQPGRSHRQPQRQRWTSRHTVLWAVSCKIVTAVVSGAFWYCR